ncbi:MAG TPA: thioredoxin domain-containing protein [Solirubrobacter sp.]|nr:thioredoxin domain-containing protein [Solirubrobacter sp.]
MTMTKRELREQRRAHRLAAERAAAAKETRRRRLWRLGIAAGVAAAIVAIVAAVSSSNEPPGPDPQAAALFAGIEEHNGVLGDPNAPLTVTEYVDLQCPVCAEASKQTLPTLINDYVRTGKVKLQARTLSFLGPDSVRAAKVAAGAQQQGRLWPFLETFYASQGTENSGYVTDDFLREVAAAAGVDADKALDYAETPEAQKALDRADQDAAAVGADSTPTFTVKRGDGSEKILAVGVTDLGPALDKELAR